MIRKAQQPGIAFAQRRRRGLQRLDDFGNFPVFGRFEFNGQIALGEFRNRLLQIRNL